MQRTYPAPVRQKPTRQSAISFKGIIPRNLFTWVLVSGAILFFLISMTVIALVLGAGVIYASGRILPGVSVAGIGLGGMTLDDATAQLQAQWSQVLVRDNQRVWTVAPEQIGLTLDAAATALSAQHHGRGDGAWLSALFGLDSVNPVVTFNQDAAQKGLKDLMPTLESPAQNATVRILDGGNAVAVPALQGRSLDLNATIARIAADPASELADGALDLVMVSTQPTVTDASPLVDRAKALLASPLTINAYDPISNQNTGWTLPPDQWGQWLTTDNSPNGIVFSVEANALSNFLNGQGPSLGEGRHFDVAKAVESIRKNVAAGNTSTFVQVLHSPQTYVVQSGDTIGSLSWKFGMPMWHFSRANSGLDMDSLSVGQKITIPSLDEMLPLPVVYGKRIVVSISKQHMTVYDNGQIKWDWVASTGIADSPTLPGIFQVQSHEVNAYAGNWNLWMPNFMGIYEAVPGFMNGIHGFPTRNGQGILWEANLGTRVTYGCILISSKNARALYDWAEDGVVIEIQA